MESKGQQGGLGMEGRQRAACEPEHPPESRQGRDLADVGAEARSYIPGRKQTF